MDRMNQLHIHVTLSLKEISLRKVAILLLETEEHLNLLRWFHGNSKNDGDKMEEWNDLINEVKKQIPKLELPEPLKEELKPLLKPIASEIIKWIDFHEHYFYMRKDFIHCLDMLSWSSEGTIDYRKTAGNIVKHKQLNLITHYQQSCLFCLEEDIQAIWKTLSDEEKVLCNGKEASNTLHAGIMDYWTCILSCDLTAPFDCMWVAKLNGCTIYQYAFENAATTGNLVATQYFFSKLIYEERESLVRTAHKVAKKISVGITAQPGCFPKECHRDVLNYLLTQMSYEEYVEVFKTYPKKVLSSYMDWPRQNMFPKILEQIWSFLPPEDYDSLICMMAKNLNTSAYDYSKLFGELFLRSPLSHKMLILEKQCEYGTFLSALFEAGDTVNIKLILRNVDSFTKEELFICDPGFLICLKLLLEGRWYLLDLFIQECALSKDVRLRIQERFKLYLSRIYTIREIKSLKYRMNKFFNMVSPTVATNCTKRKSKAQNPKCKKLCST